MPNKFIVDESFPEVQKKTITFIKDTRIFGTLFRKCDGDFMILEGTFTQGSKFNGYLHELSNGDLYTLEIFLFKGDLEHRYVADEIPSDFIDFLIEEDLNSYETILIPNIHKSLIDVE